MKIHNNHQIFWTQLIIEEGSFYIAATKNGLCFIGSQNAPIDELKNWKKKQLPCSVLIENDQELESYKRALIDYFNGDQKQINVPTDVHGTDFQKQVWCELKQIPYGQTVTYSWLANKIGNDKAVRAVASAIGANPILIIIPCHRVIGKSGKLTGYRGRLEMKEKLLIHEGWLEL